MSKYQQLKEQINKIEAHFDTEKVALGEAQNRILQEDIIADMDMPPQDKSAMDGYACRMQDIDQEMEMLEVIPAGKVAEFKIGPGQCSKIMTGAFIPQGADTVFMVEHSEETADGKIRCTNSKTNRNVCYRGEDYQKGQKLISKGVVIQVPHLAVMAGAGYSEVAVSCMPKAAIIATGSELVEPTEIPQNGKIRNSNATQLQAQLHNMNFPVDYLGIYEDDFEKLNRAFEEAFESYQVLFFTGGASQGDFDWIPKILENQGFNIFWDKTGIKPGNPMTFARKDNKFCFGLSGNPVSSLVQFELIAKPTLYKILGAQYRPQRLQLKIENDYKRKKGNRFALVPVFINDMGNAELIKFNGSAHLNALVDANAFLEVPENKLEYKKGEEVYVRPIQ